MIDRDQSQSIAIDKLPWTIIALATFLILVLRRPPPQDVVGILSAVLSYQLHWAAGIVAALCLEMACFAAFDVAAREGNQFGVWQASPLLQLILLAVLLSVVFEASGDLSHQAPLTIRPPILRSSHPPILPSPHPPIPPSSLPSGPHRRPSHLHRRFRHRLRHRRRRVGMLPAVGRAWGHACHLRLRPLPHTSRLHPSGGAEARS